MTTAPLMATTALAALNIEIELNGPDPRRSPVAARFFKHWPRPCPAVVGMIGPTGSGKTGTLFRKIFRLAQRQPVSPVVGMRHFKAVSIAGTYRQNWRGPIPSYLKVLPKHLGEWHGSGPDSPASHEIYVRLPDGSTLHYIHEFVAIGDRYGTEQELEEIFRGWEATVIHLVEMDTLPALALDFALNRSGRYPDVKHGLAPWYGVLFDMNSPRQTSWAYTRLREKWTEGREFFVQPPAVLRDGAGGFVVNPEAENQENLPPGYYDGQIRNQKIEFVRRFLVGEHLPDARGKPIYGFYTDGNGNVFGCFDARKHIAKRAIEPLRGVPLGFGTDGGVEPGGGFFQLDPRTGQVRVIREIVTSHGTLSAKYAEIINAALASPPFDGQWPRRDFGLRDIVAAGDPSAFFGGDPQQGESEWIIELRRLTGIDFRPGGGAGNILKPRIEVLQHLLEAPDVAPGQPKFLIDPSCSMLIQGLEGGYRYAEKRINSEKPQYEEKPEKNSYSHPIEGLQYGLLRMLGSDAAWGRYDRSSRPSGARASITENNEDGNFYARAPRAGRGPRPARVD